MNAMFDDIDNAALVLDPPDPDHVYANYLETCRRAGVKPVPRERAHDLMTEWFDARSRRSISAAPRSEAPRYLPYPEC